MIVRRNRAALPLGVSVGLRRQRLERGLVDRGEQLVAALVQSLHHLRVDAGDALANRVVQLREGEETTITELAEQVPRYDAYRIFDLGLVAGTSYACRE